MLERIKLLLNRFDCKDPEFDHLLRVLITLCEDEATAYCNLPEYDEILDYIVVQMVIERYNRMGSEGATEQRTSGVTTVYDSFYSEKVRKMLNKHRKLKTV